MSARVTSDIVEAKGQGKPVIGTHDGTFHADEVLACSMLCMLPQYREATIVRSRDKEVLQQCDIAVDVGGIYDAATNRYDHHQREFTDTMHELGYSTRLSSAGLVYRHFGAEVLALLAPDTDARALYKKVYKSFMEEIDGIDNGKEAFDGQRQYDVTTTLSARVGELNAQWNDDKSTTNARFATAMGMVGKEFASRVLSMARCWWPARSLVLEALNAAKDVHPTREILVFKNSCPWDAHLFELEEELAAAGDADVKGAAKYVLYAEPAPSTKWRIQAVPVEEGSFSQRKSLPEAWRGVRDAALSEKSGIDGCIFVHAGGFIGGNETYAGALEMARKALLSA